MCQTGNAGALILNGYTSSVSGWEYSIDGGLLWTAIANTTSQQPFSNISQTTMYRSIVSSGSCPNDTSLTAIITIDSLTVGGAVTLSDTVCAGQNSGVLSISGSTGIVTGWEMSTDGGTTWIIIANALPTQGYNNLIATTSYRAQVKMETAEPLSLPPQPLRLIKPRLPELFLQTLRFVNSIIAERCY